MTAREEFAKALRELRRASNLTQKQLVEVINSDGYITAEPTVSRALRGHSVPDWVVIQAIVQAAGGSHTNEQDIHKLWAAAASERDEAKSVKLARIPHNDRNREMAESLVKVAHELIHLASLMRSAQSEDDSKE